MITIYGGRNKNVQEHTQCLNTTENFFNTKLVLDFPGGPVVGSPPDSAGDTDLIPGLERFHMAQGN